MANSQAPPTPMNLTVLQNQDIFALKHFKLSYCPLTNHTECRNCKTTIAKQTYALQIIKINRLQDEGFCKQCTPIILRALLLTEGAEFVLGVFVSCLLCLYLLFLFYSPDFDLFDTFFFAQAFMLV